MTDEAPDQSAAARRGSGARGRLLDGGGGALYVHLQAENGVSHRTVVLSPRRVRTLRVLFSWWGASLVLALAGSWVYFAVQSIRVPILTQRVADLRSELARVDTLGARLKDLQQRYDQVQRMLGVVPADSAAPDSNARRNPQEED